MNLCFTETAWEDYLWFQDNDPRLIVRINVLIRDAKRSPFKGIGKPEPLKGELQGCWSRRITEEHRLVYRVESAHLVILACRYHYERH